MFVVSLILLIVSLVLPVSNAFPSPVPARRSGTPKTTILSSTPATTTTSLFASGDDQDNKILPPPVSSLLSSSSTSSSSSSQKIKTSSSPAGDFAYQEMIVLLTAMQKEGATSRSMDPTKRSELEGYIQTVIQNNNNNQHRSIPLENIGTALFDPVSNRGSEWKLMFSSSDAVLESLPTDATIFINIQDKQRLDYKLQFSMQN